MSFLPALLARGLIAGALLLPASAFAAPAIASSTRSDATVQIPPTLAVRKDLGAPPAGVTELKFRDVFQLPVGPKGLQPTAKLLALDGKRVRIVGYMVQESASQGALLLSPLPAMLGHEDESLADDLPASAIRIEFPEVRDVALPFLPGLLQFTGTLHVGMQLDAVSGRSTPARIVLDADDQRVLRDVVRNAVPAAAKTSH